MTSKTLICYTFDKINPTKRKQFDRELFGTTEKSHNGRYATKVKGYLTNKKFRKPVKSTILIENKDTTKVSKILNKYHAKFELFKISK